VFPQQSGEVGTGELTALIRVEAFGDAITMNCPLHGIEIEIGRQATSLMDVGNVGGLALVRAVDDKVTQQVSVVSLSNFFWPALILIKVAG
jgi:hypothetical protein